MEATATTDDTEPKRKRHVIVVKKIGPKSPKKPVYVARKVRDAAELAEMEESLLGTTSPQVYSRDIVFVSLILIAAPHPRERWKHSASKHPWRPEVLRND